MVLKANINKAKKTAQATIRLEKETKQWLDGMSKQLNCPSSQVIRSILRLSRPYMKVIDGELLADVPNA